MHLNNPFQDSFNGISTDFTAEVVAAEMIENGTSADRVLIIPIGAIRRPQNKDIESVFTEVSDYDNKEYIVIKTHKEGIYDKMPEGLFHNPISYSGDKTELQVIEGIRRHRIEEKAARLFFLPFDTALYNGRVQIALYENQLDKKFHNNQLINIFSPHWEIFRYLNVLQSNIFLQYLPMIHSIRDDWNVIENFFELIFQTPAHIAERTVTRENDTVKNAVTKSGDGFGILGFDLTTGSPVDGGMFSEIVIKFGPLSAEEVSFFVGEQQQERVVLMLGDYLLPADADITIEYDLIPNDRVCILDEAGHNCTMGISTYL